MRWTSAAATTRTATRGSTPSRCGGRLGAGQQQAAWWQEGGGSGAHVRAGRYLAGAGCACGDVRQPLALPCINGAPSPNLNVCTHPPQELTHPQSNHPPTHPLTDRRWRWPSTWPPACGSGASASRRSRRPRARAACCCTERRNAAQRGPPGPCCLQQPLGDSGGSACGTQQALAV